MNLIKKYLLWSIGIGALFTSCYIVAYNYVLYNMAKESNKINLEIPNFIKPENRVGIIFKPLVGKQADAGLDCDNIQEYGSFEKPVPVEWTAKFTGCLSGCVGASFLRFPEDVNYQYPRFAGYFNGELPEESREEDIVFIISGDWIGIGDDYYRSVFNNQCVPIVDIKKVEIVKD